MKQRCIDVVFKTLKCTLHLESELSPYSVVESH